MNTPAVLIMAAGRGTRMRSRLPKVLHPLCGRPMLLWTVQAAREAGAERVVVVLGEEADEVRGVLPPDVEVAIQDPPAGTGDAVAQARDALAGSEHVIVLSGDHPLLDGAFIAALAERHASSGSVATVTTRELEDPRQYGRIVRGADGEIERIVETKNPGDATPEEIAIKEINAGTYAFAVGTAARGARARAAPTTPRASTTSETCCRLLRAAGHGGRGAPDGRRGGRLGINTAPTWRSWRQIAAAQTARAPHARRASRSWIRRSTVIDVGRDDRRGHDNRAVQSAAGRDEVGPGSTIGPMTTLTDA